MKLEIKQRGLLKSKDIKAFVQEIKNIVNEDTFDKLFPKDKKITIERIKIGKFEIIYSINKVPTFWVNNNTYIPLMTFLKDNFDVPWKYVVVDKGAIPFMAKGADCMRPGITEIDPTIKKDDIVVVRDIVNKRVLCVSQAIYGAKTMQSMDKGKVLLCVHSITDKIYEFTKDF